MRHLLEEGETITLDQLFKNNPPEQWVRDMFGSDELDVPLPIKEVDPKILYAHGNPLTKLVKEADRPPHRSVVRHYLKNPGDPILVDGPNIYDGHHRAMAAFLQKRPIKVVDIRDWPMRESEEFYDIDDLDVGIPVPMEEFLNRFGYVSASPPSLGWERIFNRGEHRMRISHPEADGIRTVQFMYGNLALWTKRLNDEEVAELVERHSRPLGENEEDFDDDDDEIVDAGVPSIQHVLKQSGFQERNHGPRESYFIKQVHNHQYMVWSGYDNTWYFHTYVRKWGQFRQDEQFATEDPNQLLGWLRNLNLLKE